MTIREIHRQAEEEKWGKIVRECRSSGQTVMSWCEERNLSTKTYYRWEKKVVQAGGLKEEELGVIPPKAPEFVEMPRVHESSLACEPTGIGRRDAATVRYGAVEIDIYEGADAGVLETLWRMMSHAK